MDKTEQEITEEMFNISKINMGPAITEGDIYHAKHSITILSRRTKVAERKNQELAQYVDALTSSDLLGQLRTSPPAHLLGYPSLNLSILISWRLSSEHRP